MACSIPRKVQDLFFSGCWFYDDSALLDIIQAPSNLTILRITRCGLLRVTSLESLIPSEECRWAGLGDTGQMPAARCVLDISGCTSLRIGNLGRTNRIQFELDAVAAARNSKDVISSFARMPHAGTACPCFAHVPFVRLVTYIIDAPDGVNGCSITPIVILCSQSIGTIARMALRRDVRGQARGSAVQAHGIRKDALGHVHR
jgi:hypothetical protein